jgi:itaconate CoA-transferase
MATFEAMYKNKLTSADEAVSAINKGTSVCFGMAAGSPPALLTALAKRIRNGALTDLRLYYKLAFEPAAEAIMADDILSHIELNPLFLTEFDRRIIKKQMQIGKKILNYVPNYFYQIPRLFSEFIPIDTFLITVSSMDRHGYFSLGTNNDYASTVIRSAKRVILEVNKHMPRVFGDSLVHISEVDHIIENDTALFELVSKEPTAQEEKIASVVAEMIPDEATIQLGIGGVPNSVCKFLASRKDLGIHTELLTTGMAQLIEFGVITGSKKTIHKWKHVFTVALGDRSLYDVMDNNPAMESYSSAYVNNPAIIAQNNRMISVNSALEIDLYGQVSSESIGWHEFSGTGGALDFMRGAFDAPGGRSILALQSTAKNGTISRIVPRLTSLVTDPRMDVEWVVTEHGATNLKGRSTKERALALINLADPKFREDLIKEAENSTLIGKGERASCR